MDPRLFLRSAIFCHLPLLCSRTHHFVPPSRSSHTSTGGLSLVGIHQGPSLTPAMLQCRRTITGSGRPSLLESTERVCVGVCTPICACFNHAYYICINIYEEMQASFYILVFYCSLSLPLKTLSANVREGGCRGHGALALWKVLVRCQWMGPLLSKQAQVKPWEFFKLRLWQQHSAVCFLLKVLLYLTIHLQREPHSSTMQNSVENGQSPLKDLRNQVAWGCVSLLSCQDGTPEKHSCGNEFADKTHDVGKRKHKSITLPDCCISY